MAGLSPPGLPTTCSRLTAKQYGRARPRRQARPACVPREGQTAVACTTQADRMKGVPAGSTRRVWLGLVIVAVIGVGLPVSAWWLTRRMAAAKPPYSGRRMDAFGAPMDAIDVWLADHTDLPALRRWSVRQAVLGGRAANDESLRPVAGELASELLAGRVRSDIGGWSGWALAAAGGSAVIFAFAVRLVVGHVVPWLLPAAIFGALPLTAGLIRPKLLRHRLEQAMRLNR